MEILSYYFFFKKIQFLLRFVGSFFKRLFVSLALIIF